MFAGIGIIAFFPGALFAAQNVPAVITNIPVYVEEHSAELRGAANQGTAENASIWFEYGMHPDNLFISTGKTPFASIFNAYSNIDGLSAGTTYYFRLVAENDAGRTNGNTRSFTTKSSPVSNSSGSGNNSNTTGTNTGGSSVDVINSVVTKNATEISDTLMVVHADVSFSEKVSAQGWFEYGTTQSLGEETSIRNLNTGTQLSFSDALTDLKQNTTYYYRGVVRVGDKTERGAILSNKTEKKITTVVVNNSNTNNTYGPSGRSEDSYTETVYEENNSFNQTNSALALGVGSQKFLPDTFGGWFLAVIVLALIIWISTILFGGGKRKDREAGEAIERNKELEFEQEIRQEMTKKASTGVPLPGQETS